jgi:4-alpha-glucanotransferase
MTVHSQPDLDRRLKVVEDARPSLFDSYPNWRRRLPVTLEDLTRQDGVMTIAEGMRAAGRSLPTGQ